MKRIIYKNGKATIGTIEVRIKGSAALVSRGATVVKLTASSPHKVKIAVKRVLKGFDVPFTQERRLR